MTAYNKPHLSYQDQVQLMKSRGLACPDEADAVELLKQVGYYRLSAYVYPFRELLPANAARISSPAHYRSEAIAPGVSFDHVRKLWNFDRKLRLKFLDALEVLEIGLRTRVAYVLGEHNKFGHLDDSSLDRESCAKLCLDGQTDRFTDWLRRYDSLKAKAKNEDYVVHHMTKYGDPVPVWIAVEFLDFGALCGLYGLLTKSHQNTIAKSMGVKGGVLLGRWLRVLNYVRNVCAHHSRLWNRVPTYQSAKFNPNQVDDDLKHAARWETRDKIYVPAATLAYLVRHIDPSSAWHLGFRSHLQNFPKVPGKSPETDMGFPQDWSDMTLWKSAPQ